MKARIPALALALALAAAACATPGGPSPSTPRGAASISSTPMALGEFRTARADSVARAFGQTVTNRYGAGVALSAAAADLSRQNFTCAAGPTGRGDPPDQICRRTVRYENCAHTWQVLLYNDPGQRGLSRSRGLYDRACRNDDSGLLGGN